MVTHEVETLVVGLGPVGAVAALYLAQQGIEVACIEARRTGATDLRASTFHAPTIEMLDQLGAAEVLLSEGLQAPVYQFRDRKSDEVFSFDLGEIADSTRFPFRMQCEQHRVTDSIVEKLRNIPNCRVAHNQRLLFLMQDETGIVAIVETPNSVERYRGKFLVAADGANSVVRKLLGLGFDGFTYDEKFLCFSTKYPIERSFEQLAYVNYISDPEEWMVLLRVPSLWRILVPASAEASDEELLSDETKNSVFRRMLKAEVDVETQHRTIYRVHQRVCAKFAINRVALAGDAVHLNSPMGGFGMNSGIHDAVNLCEKLVQILRLDAPLDLLQVYHRQRHSVTTEFVQSQTIENTRMMSEGWGGARNERRARMMNLQKDGAARRAFLLRQSMITSLRDAASIT